MTEQELFDRLKAWALKKAKGEGCFYVTPGAESIELINGCWTLSQLIFYFEEYENVHDPQRMVSIIIEVFKDLS